MSRSHHQQLRASLPGFTISSCLTLGALGDLGPARSSPPLPQWLDALIPLEVQRAHSLTPDAERHRVRHHDSSRSSTLPLRRYLQVLDALGRRESTVGRVRPVLREPRSIGVEDELRRRVPQQTGEVLR